MKKISKKTAIKNITLPPELIAIVDSRRGDDIGFSTQVAADLATYYLACDLGLKSLRKKLTRSEVSAILDVMNGTYWGPESLWTMIPTGISINVSDGCALDGLDKKWDIDGPALVKKLEACDALETLALLDFVKAFWQTCDNKTVTLEKTVEPFLPTTLE